MSGSIPEEEEGPPQWWHRIENGAVTIILALMVAIPVVAVSIRIATGSAIPGANLWVQALNLWLAFLGGGIAARKGTHLALSTGSIFQLEGRRQEVVTAITASVATAITFFLAYGSVDLVISEMESAQELPGGVPNWVIQIAMPVGFGIMAARFLWRGQSWRGRVAAAVTTALVACMAFIPPGERDWAVWAGAFVLLVGVALGAPLFTVMGGAAMLLFWGAPIPIAITAVPAETYRIVADPTLVSLPLFTLAGYLLAEGGASKRLVALFNAWFGWLPGGVAAASVLVCAFFTTFTGASGVTILALGGLLLPALEAAGYKKSFAVGLLAASGSIGLLFPPSLPVILYGVAAKIPITDLFIGGVIPGIILVSLLVGMGIVAGIRDHGFRYWLPAEDADKGAIVRERGALMGKTLWAAKFEVMLPVVVLFGIFGGYMTIFEAAAFTAFYAILLETVIHRDLHPINDVPRVMVETATLMGGVLVILGVALGFTSYLVDAEVPLAVRDWVQARVENRLVFILLLNLLLLLVGCLMDIYSAIVVVVPLIIPVAEVFGIHPVHLGILFLANLELGYLTPPVGLNLFLASFRFKLPLTAVYRYAMPFLAMMGLGVLIIAYVPIATTWPFDETSHQPKPDFFSEDPTGDPQPKGPDPDMLDQLMNELEDDAPAPAPAKTPPAPGSLNIDDLMNELEDE
ncbi:MAG: TRAP transporter large permease subunit [Alphaproteobacteria bacterium]|nr:TRAP transporter large permease subunit [Alphaproteobacteria bacterium]